MVCSRSSKYLILLGLPLATGISILSSEIIRIIYGSSWNASAPALKILIWAWALVFIDCVLPVALNATRHTQFYIITVVLVTLVNIALNSVLIPRWGVLGCSLVTVICELIAGIGYYICVRFIIGPVIIIPNLWRPIAGSFVMALIVFTLREAGVILPLLILVGGVVYVASILLLRPFDETDQQLLTKILGGYLTGILFRISPVVTKPILSKGNID
jgi:O-antigen/teichoic acid export membrane protein